jgi:hypothetical protein
MKRNKSFILVCATVLSLALGLNAAAAADVEGHKTIAGLSVYLGVLPAAMVRDHSGDRTEATMHGGLPRGHAHHVMAAVFDAKTGERVEDARVKARVSPPGLAGETRALEPMAIAGTITYGNYFTTIGDRQPYRIRLSITLAGTATPVVVEFSHHRRQR